MRRCGVSNSLERALHSDYARMGLAHYLPGQNAFTATVPRATSLGEHTPPKRRGRKASNGSITLETFAQRQERKLAREKKITAFSTAAKNNFSTDPVPSKPVKTASSRFATA